MLFEKSTKLLIRQCRLPQSYVSQRYYYNRNILHMNKLGLIKDIYPEQGVNSISKMVSSKLCTVYAGFDPTADSLHIGNLLVLMNLLHWQRGGHKVIIVIGDATARIGDPSGRNAERDPMTVDEIEKNTIGLKENISEIFKHHAENIYVQDDKLPEIKYLRNSEWYKDVSVLDMLSTSGRDLRMGAMLSRASAKIRLGSQYGMSFAEFSYQLFQAYDWLHLLRDHQCQFQVGGQDQMGNIMSGHEMISRHHSDVEVFGLTTPLITTQMGEKLGKSAGNAIWLKREKTSPFRLYQHFLQTADDKVEKYLRLYTFLHVNTIEKLVAQHRDKPEEMRAQKVLAEQVATLVHGEKGLEEAQKTTSILFEEGGVQVLGNLTQNEVNTLFEGATIVHNVHAEPGQTALDLAMQINCFACTNDALKIIGAGGFSINQQKVTNPSEVLNFATHRLPNNITLLRVGKKRNFIVNWA